MGERRNDPEIVIGTYELLRRPKLGSISSLRCQKSRTRVPQDATCEVMFRGRCFQRQAFQKQAHRSSIPSGGARRDRTDDLMLAKHALSQLSYGPVPEDECFKLNERRIRSIKVVGLGRLELPTSRLSSARSNQLSYKPNYCPTSQTFNARLRAGSSLDEERETKTAGVPPDRPDWPLCSKRSRKLKITSDRRC